MNRIIFGPQPVQWCISPSESKSLVLSSSCIPVFLLNWSLPLWPIYNFLLLLLKVHAFSYCYFYQFSLMTGCGGALVRAITRESQSVSQPPFPLILQPDIPDSPSQAWLDRHSLNQNKSLSLGTTQSTTALNQGSRVYTCKCKHRTWKWKLSLMQKAPWFALLFVRLSFPSLLCLCSWLIQHVTMAALSAVQANDSKWLLQQRSVSWPHRWHRRCGYLGWIASL